jgi:hypothetical protein
MGIVTWMSVLFLLLFARCVSADGELKAHKIASELNRDFQIGMKRADVERQLTGRHDLTYVYEPRGRILISKNRSANGVEFSGVVSVTTFLEIKGPGAKAQAFITIGFDERDKVVDVRVEGIGLGTAGPGR